TAVVLPLLLPELPVFTWWEGTPPFGEEVFAELTSVTDPLIVDSAALESPPRAPGPRRGAVAAGRLGGADGRPGAGRLVRLPAGLDAGVGPPGRRHARRRLPHPRRGPRRTRSG